MPRTRNVLPTRSMAKASASVRGRRTEAVIPTNEDGPDDMRHMFEAVQQQQQNQQPDQNQQQQQQQQQDSLLSPQSKKQTPSPSKNNQQQKTSTSARFNAALAAARKRPPKKTKTPKTKVQMLLKRQPGSENLEEIEDEYDEVSEDIDNDNDDDYYNDNGDEDVGVQKYTSKLKKSGNPVLSPSEISRVSTAPPTPGGREEQVTPMQEPELSPIQPNDDDDEEEEEEEEVEKAEEEEEEEFPQPPEIEDQQQPEEDEVPPEIEAEEEVVEEEEQQGGSPPEMEEVEEEFAVAHAQSGSGTEEQPELLPSPETDFASMPQDDDVDENDNNDDGNNYDMGNDLGPPSMSDDEISEEDAKPTANSTPSPEKEIETETATPEIEMSTPQKKTPTPTPQKKTPTPTPKKNTPMTTPKKNTSMTTPKKKTPTPKKNTPMATPKTKTPTPKKNTPMTTPKTKTPTVTPKKKTPTPTPKKKTPITTPKNNTPITTPKKKSPTPKKKTPTPKKKTPTPKKSTPKRTPKQAQSSATKAQPKTTGLSDTESDDETQQFTDANDGDDEEIQNGNEDEIENENDKNSQEEEVSQEEEDTGLNVVHDPETPNSVRSKRAEKEKEEIKRKKQQMEEDSEEATPQQKSKKRKKREALFTPKGRPTANRSYESKPLSEYIEESPEDANLRRSKRARCPPLEFWRNEKQVYGAHDEKGELGRAMGDMPVVKEIVKALPTPYQKRKPNPPTKSARKKVLKRPEVEESLVMENEPYDSRKLRKKLNFVDGEAAFLWDEQAEESMEMKVIAFSKDMHASDLPISSARTKAEGTKVGKAAQAFNIPNDEDDNYVGFIMGNLTLPCGAIKDAESVGYCSQLFTVCQSQPGALEVAYGDPDMSDGALNPETAQRFLLGPGDMFRVPPGNSYRLQNHSTTTKSLLTWVIIRPRQHPPTPSA